MKICKVDGCENNAITKGYCKKHYIRFWKYGNPFYTPVGRDIEHHGLSDIPEYGIWANIKNRCYSKNYHSFQNYGGRGIKICNRWKNSFIAFFKDMGQRPFPKATIDRINNDGNYELANCRWTTNAENCRNKSNNKLTVSKAAMIRLLYCKPNISQRDLAKAYNVSQNLIHNIIHNKRWATTTMLRAKGE